MNKVLVQKIAKKRDDAQTVMGKTFRGNYNNLLFGTKRLKNFVSPLELHTNQLLGSPK